MLTHRTAAASAESEIPRTESLSSVEKDPKADLQDEKEKVDVESLVVSVEDVDDTVIKKDEEVAIEVCNFADFSDASKLTFVMPLAHRSSHPRITLTSWCSRSGRSSWASACPRSRRFSRPSTPSNPRLPPSRSFSA